MKNTVALIERELRIPGGGVRRYIGDTYYGGGEWLLLTAWLGWFYTEINLPSLARELMSWIEDQADHDGNLPEQVSDNLTHSSYLEYWNIKHGRIACPLLWSHAKYIILFSHLNSLLAPHWIKRP